MKLPKKRVYTILSTTLFLMLTAAAFLGPAYFSEVLPAEPVAVLPEPAPSLLVSTKKISPQEMALLDTENRLSPEFAVPRGMEKRVAFWLDVYTKYDSRNYIIHHREYPWIVFDVVDTSDIFAQQRSHKWMNRQDADTLSQVKKDAVIATLKMLLVRSNETNLSSEEARVLALINEIPGPRKQVLREAIKALRIQLGQKDMFEMGLVRSAPFIPAMEQIFQGKGLPRELVRLPLVESSFNIDAHSRVGAKGAWQIMPGIGRKGMMIDNIIDERDSPLKSTQFAAFILKQNKQILKTWPLAVTAYNHGTGSLLKAIKKLKSQELQDIIDLNNEKSFQFASSNFYACFMAALRGELYAKELFPELKRPEPLRLTRVKVSKKTSVSSFAKQSGLDLKSLQAANPDLPNNLRPNFQIPSGFYLYVPQEKQVSLENTVSSLTPSAPLLVLDR